MQGNTALVAFERQLAPLAPHFADVLGRAMPAERLIRTLLISCEKTPKLLDCHRQSLMNGAMTFAVLALEIDGATGQGYLIPFNDRKQGMLVAQPVIGYRGLNTLGARSGFTITGAVVREGDEFDYDEGSKPFVHHKRKLGGEKDRKILAAWSAARSNERPPTFKILSIDELLAVKAKSPRGNEPPWNDPAIGFPAMCEKTAKRRLARDMPLNVFQLAARMEEAFEEQGKPSYITKDRSLVIEGEIMEPSPTPTAAQLLDSPRTTKDGHAAETSSVAEGNGTAADEGPDREITELDGILDAAADKGMAALQAAWKTLRPSEQTMLKAALDRRHKVKANAVDAKVPS